MLGREGGEGPRATVHVIVTCANRMSRPIPEHLQLGQVPGRTPAERASGWIARLAEACSAAQVPAVELYAGEHWSVARKFPAMHLPGEEICLWACSAGYGLIPVEAPLIPHHATLTRGQADSVPGVWTSWWSMLSEWPGPASGRPRSIRALVASDPTAIFMFVLSKNYLAACRADLAAACEHLADSDRFFIVSAGGRPEGDLAAFTLPADARLQAYFGGTRRALNARIGGSLLEHRIRSKDEASAYLTRLLDAQSPIPRYNRKRQSDPEILDIIAERLARGPSISANRLLRELRDSGLACEQHRFGRLYRLADEAAL
jgi:hypothetical protein